MLHTETRQISVGGVPIGGGAPVAVQSMTNTHTTDVEATLAQIGRLREAGCDIVRITVPDMPAARALGEIRARTDMPIVADIHFDWRMAIEAVEAGADKIRINPGNIGGAARVKAVVAACRTHGVPIRIGVNGGSLEKDLLARYGHATPQAMVESIRRNVELVERFDYNELCLSLKASDVPTTVAAYRLAAAEFPYPLHVGITHTGAYFGGLIQSAAGIGALLLDGIGDTIRVSLTADPVEEVRTGIEILKAAGLRREGVRIISCPTCGRCNYDLIPAVEQVQQALKDGHRTITVAVMGCVVNGPGEAQEADYGVAGGLGYGVLFRKGQVVAKVDIDRLIPALLQLIQEESETDT